MIPAVDTIQDERENTPEKEFSWLVRCEICLETIAELDPGRAALPMKGNMFLSPDVPHGIPAPFDDSLEWVDMKCPVCHWRPFLEQDSMLLDSGRYYIENKKGGDISEEEGRMQTETKDIKPTQQNKKKRRGK